MLRAELFRVGLLRFTELLLDRLLLLRLTDLVDLEEELLLLLTEPLFEFPFI